MRRLQVVGQRLARSAAGVVVGEVVVADAEQPAGKVTLGPEVRQVGKRLEERFLCQVLGGVLVARQVVEPAVQPVPVLLDEAGKSRTISLLSTANERVLLGAGVVDRLGRRHAQPSGVSQRTAYPHRSLYRQRTPFARILLPLPRSLAPLSV